MGASGLKVLCNAAVPDAPRASGVTLPVTAGKQLLHLKVPGTSAPHTRSVSAEAHVTVNHVDACRMRREIFAGRHVDLLTPLCTGNAAHVLHYLYEQKCTQKAATIA